MVAKKKKGFPPGLNLRRTLSGYYAGKINRLVWMPGGQKIAAGCNNGVLLWDAATGEELHKPQLLGPPGMFWPGLVSVSKTPTGLVLDFGPSFSGIPPLTIGADKLSGVLLNRFTGHEDFPLDSLLRFEPSLAEMLMQHSPETAKLIAPYLFPYKPSMRWGHSDTVYTVATAANGDWVISGSKDGTVKVWDARNNELIVTLEGHTGSVFGIAATSDGKRIVSASYDRSLRVWQISGKESEHLLTLEGHTYYVRAVVLTPDEQKCISGSADNSIRVWDINSGKELVRLRGHTGDVNALALTPDGQTLASASSDATVRLWNWREGRTTTVLEGHAGRITGVSFSSDGRLLATKAQDNTVRLWRCDTWETIAILEELHPGSGFADIAFHPTQPILATLGDGGEGVRIWDLDLDALFVSAPISKAIQYTTAKIVLVGDQGVGKTGLGWRIAHGEYKEQSSTHGQQFWVIDELGITRADGAECEAILWDHAGQPTYRIIHAIFLEDVDLALVLFDPTN